MITNASQLEELLHHLKAVDRVAVDTEADSLHCYREKLCLLQISVPGRDFLVDPLAEVDLAPLRVTAQGAEKLLTERDTVMMAAAREGKGQVIALGDPWLYNEYLYTQDNRRIAEELFRKILK